MSIQRFCGLAMMVGLSAVGCGGGSGGLAPRDACDQLSSAQCERTYACYTAAEIQAAGLPATEAACATQLQASRGCTEQTTSNTCTGNEKYHADQANLCVEQVMGLQCSQWRDPNLDDATATPACVKVCSV